MPKGAALPQEGGVDAQRAREAFQKLPRLQELVQLLTVLGRVTFFRQLCSQACP